MTTDTLLRPPTEDAALVLAAQAGDEDAFRQLVDRHYRRIYRFLLKHAISAVEAEDLTQEAFLQAYLGLASFRGESRCSSWLVGIALNLVRNYTNRSSWRLIETDIDELPPRVVLAAANERTAAHSPEYDAAYHEALDALTVALGKLSPEEHDSMMLVAVEGMPYEEAAVLLGEPIGSVKSQVCRARRQLRAHLDPGHLDVLSGRV